MERRRLLFAALAASACARRNSQETPNFPANLSDWKLESGPENVQGIGGAQGSWTARYSGTPPLRVTVHRMSSQTGAFAQVQSWRAEPHKLAFYKEAYFAIVEGDGADHATLNRFANALQAAFP